MLCLAAAIGDKDTVEILIECGARVSATTAFGQSPLHFAAANGHVSVGEHIALASFSSTSLIFPLQCAFLPCVCTVETLLDLDAAASPSNKYGVTPLHLAASGNRASVCKVLCQHGAALDVRIIAFIVYFCEKIKTYIYYYLK